jgi:hypothetical protein
MTKFIFFAEFYGSYSLLVMISGYTLIMGIDQLSWQPILKLAQPFLCPWFLLSLPPPSTAPC